MDPKPKPSPWGRRWRNLHYYLATLGTAVSIFFAITGLLLNHPTWFNGKDVQQQELQIDVPAEVLSGDRLRIVEFIRSQGDFPGLVDEYADDGEIITFNIETPSRQAEIEIDRSSAAALCYSTIQPTAASLGHLHQGKHSPWWWTLFIDIAAILMLVAAITGIGLMWQLPKKRVLGLSLSIGGSVILTVLAVLTLL